MLCIFVRTRCGAGALDKEQRKKMTNRAVILAAVRRGGEVAGWPGVDKKCEHWARGSYPRCNLHK